MPLITLSNMVFETKAATDNMTPHYTFDLPEDVWCAYNGKEEEPIRSTMDGHLNGELKTFDWYAGDVTPDMLALRLMDLTDKGQLVIEQSAVPVLVTLVSYAVKNSVLYKFLERIEGLTRNKRDQVWLYRDGMPQSMSFGLIWKQRVEYNPGHFSSARMDDKGYMYGGLIWHASSNYWMTHT